MKTFNSRCVQSACILYSCLQTLHHRLWFWLYFSVQTQKFLSMKWLLQEDLLVDMQAHWGKIAQTPLTGMQSPSPSYSLWLRWSPSHECNLLLKGGGVGGGVITAHAREEVIINMVLMDFVYCSWSGFRPYVGHLIISPGTDSKESIPVLLKL
jgi:hypothetical protein